MLCAKARRSEFCFAGVEMTLGIYAHALPSMQQEAATKLAALLHG